MPCPDSLTGYLFDQRRRWLLLYFVIRHAQGPHWPTSSTKPVLHQQLIHLDESCESTYQLYPRFNHLLAINDENRASSSSQTTCSPSCLADSPPQFYTESYCKFVIQESPHLWYWYNTAPFGIRSGCTAAGAAQWHHQPVMGFHTPLVLRHCWQCQQEA